MFAPQSQNGVFNTIFGGIATGDMFFVFRWSQQFSRVPTSVVKYDCHEGANNGLNREMGTGV